MNPSMLFDLPPTSTAVSPPFSELAACRDWIARLPLANPPLSQKLLLDALQRLNAYPLPASLRLELLEALLAPLRLVQEENATLFAGKPLPLAPIEQSALDTTHALWQSALFGYLRCLESLWRGETGLESRSALVCERALALLVADFADLTRAGRQPEAELWRYAHLLYSSAETFGVAGEIVPESSGEEQGGRLISPAAAYAELALLATAALHELAPREQRWVMRWAHRWAPKVKILAVPPPLSQALPLCVDLAGEAPPRFLPYRGAGARWLETTELLKSMQKRIVLLSRNEQAVTPASLGLGEDCTMPACLQVLQHLYPRWVKGGIQRRYTRHPLQGPCRFVAGVDAIHYYISGRRTFRPPGSLSDEVLRRQREALEIFEAVPADLIEETSQALGFQIESWTIAEDWRLTDRSEEGLCLVRPLTREGGRLAIGQLVAVQPAGSSGFQLGVVRWTQRRGDELATGVQLMLGRPEAVALRRTGLMATPEPYRPGFVLLPTAHQPPAVILPPGSFKPGRVMEVWTPRQMRRVRLEELFERGADFEGARFVELK